MPSHGKSRPPLPRCVAAIAFLLFMLGADSGLAGPEEHPRRLVETPRLSPVRWSGRIEVERQGNDNQYLWFVRGDGKRFPIVESPAELSRRLADRSPLSVRIVGRATPRFLFWGGELLVDQFDVLD